MEAFKSFLQITCKHTFYNNEYLADFAINPTLACNQVLHAFGLKARNTPEGISLYYSTKSSGLLDSASDTISLTFHLDLQNPGFFQITDLEGYSQQKIINLTNEKGNKDGDKYLLHEEDYASEVDLMERSESGQNLGLITIDLDPKTLKEGGEIKMRNYEIRFKTREVYWRYFVLKSSDSKPVNDLSISGSNVSFSDPVESTLSNGAKAMMLKTISSLELKETYNFNFSLNFLLSENLTTIKLPMPDGKSIRLENGEIYADIYVYI